VHACPVEHVGISKMLSHVAMSVLASPFALFYGMSDFELIFELRYAANSKPLSLPPINRLPIASNID